MRSINRIDLLVSLQNYKYRYYEYNYIHTVCSYNLIYYYKYNCVINIQCLIKTKKNIRQTFWYEQNQNRLAVSIIAHNNMIS